MRTARSIASRVVLTAGGLLIASACASSSESRPTLAPIATPTAVDQPVPTVTVTVGQPSPTAMPTPPEPVMVRGSVVSAVDGSPLADAVVSVGSGTVTTGADGSFVLTTAALGDGEVLVARPAWMPTTVSWTPGLQPLVIELDQRVVKGLRVSAQVSADPEKFEALLAMADRTVVNTLVFDTKDESGQVLYQSEVGLANEVGATTDIYDPAELLAQAKDRGLYTVTRLVAFEDALWSRAVPDAKLAGSWVDASNPANWEYPLDLAVEACELGFDEVQFDYVRFPAGNLSAAARDAVPSTEEERSEAIAGFLAEASVRLHARGCAVSAAIFGIVMSSATDERLGQTPETVSAVVDAVSPMLYPSHYSPGWLGYGDPNDFPGPVVANALDTGGERLAEGSLLRPWLQGFYYNAAQVQAQIAEADQRGAGWIIWSADGSYGQNWLPLE